MKLSLIIVLAILLSLVSCMTSCDGLFNPKEHTTPFVRTVHAQPDGSTVTTDTPMIVVDPQKQAHAEATKNLFAE